MSWMPTSYSCGHGDSIGHVLGVQRRPTGQYPGAEQGWSPGPHQALGLLLCLALAALLALTLPTQGLFSVSLSPTRLAGGASLLPLLFTMAAGTPEHRDEPLVHYCGLFPPGSTSAELLNLFFLLCEARRTENKKDHTVGSQCTFPQSKASRELLGRGERLGYGPSTRTLQEFPTPLSAGHPQHLFHLNRSLGGLSLAPNMLDVGTRRPQGGQA